jgi:signal transduction histidine kinase/HD-like signal output (HDOD) protein
MQPPDLDNDSAIRSRLSAARLPVMPQVLVPLIEQCNSDEINMADVAELVRKDVALTARMLGLAHGDANHRSSQPLSVEQALLSLGSDTVKTLLISESVTQVFDKLPAIDGNGLDIFWKHAITAAMSAQMIASKLSYPHLEEAYIAGLLHDVGRLAMLAAAPEEYASHFLAEDDQHLCVEEKRILRIAHPEAGAQLIEHWNLDAFVADSVRYHHEPAVRLGKAHPLIRIVFLAHQMAADVQDDAAHQSVAAMLGIAMEDIASIRSLASTQVAKMARVLGIDLNGTVVTAQSGDPTASTPARHTVHDKLAEKVRDLIVASEAGRSFARQDGQSKLLEMVTQSAKLLFGFDDATVLLLKEPDAVLSGISFGEHRRRLAELSISLDSGGAIAASALQQSVTYIGGKGSAVSVVEEQLLRIFSAEYLVCLPLVATRRCYGVLIGAASSTQVAGLRRREGFLHAFSAQAAAALNASTTEFDETRRAVASVTQHYRESARRVAHEVNNPLSIIKNYLSVLDRKLAKKEPVSGEISILNEEIDRVGQIINGLGEIKPAARAATTEVNRVINDVVRLFRDTEYVPPTVQIVARTHEQAFEVNADLDMLKQILVNLIKNAVEALSAGGEITILNNGLVNRDGLLYVELRISDSGPGISADVMANLFSPVRTTKGEGHRGIGLSIVHSLVKQMQGFITCRSDKRGTTFDILLPSSTNLTTAPRQHFRNTV